MDAKIHIGNQMIDITDPGIVEVQISSDGRQVWINADGVCCLRAYAVAKLVVHDDRRSSRLPPTYSAV